ncbi:MAG TPA: TonB-dependent receptor [Prolixibacteraceae bacterium]|nr:TonB-dependent receptor [Prolixibacteraceae bacterium]
MKKHREWNSHDRLLKKLLRIMKLTSILILFFVVSVSASSYSQSTKLSIQVMNGTFIEVLKQIENQSEFYFYYNKEELENLKDVSINVSNMKIQEVMEKLLAGTNLDYKIIDRYIAITRNEDLFSGQKEMQQQKSISGKVTDASGNSLPGVTVIVKGTTRGTITDADGNYNLSNVPADGTLVFTFVGMKKHEIIVSGNSIVNAMLEEETFGIEEVVAIGYGTVKKSDLTGAVGTVQGATIAERQTTQLSQALQGAISGVMVTRDNNAPGASANIRIRGITTIGDSNPLIIVDGVPVDNINDINPNDVQDMSVLKDAASASIYGSRAAAGVILITTKRAKSGELSLNYNAEYGFEKPTELPEYVDAKRYMQMTNELKWNDNGNGNNEYPTYTKDVIDNYTTLNSENPNKYPNTNWIGLILKDNAPRQSHLLSITAGNAVIRTKASIAYDKTEALYEGRSYERITGRFNNDVNISKNLSASFDFSFKRSMDNQPSIDPIYYMLLSPPVYAATWADGRIAEGKNGNNIYGQLKYGGNRTNTYNQVEGKISLAFTPLEGLKLSAIVSPTLGFDKMKNFQKKVPYYSADDPNLYVGTMQWGLATNLFENRNDYSRVTSQLLLNYQKSFGKHNLNAMTGYENYYAFNEGLGASRENYEFTNFPYLDLGPLDLRGNNGSAFENALRSYMGRLMYNYHNKYFLQGNIRYDGSSRFHKDYRWGSFPSLSAGWVISEESFMKSIPAISFLKLRTSWGNLGNERMLKWDGVRWVPNYYPYQSTIAFANALFFQGNTPVAAQTAAQTQYAILDITWETTESVDLGIDANFFNNRLRMSGDYYQKTTKDMLLALEIPDYIGFDNPSQNTGKMNTKGWEAEMGWADKIGKLGYSISANISDFKSTMGDLGGTEFIGDQIKKEGSEFNEWYGYLSDGLFHTEEDLVASPKLTPATKVGDVKYKDISGPDGTPDGIISPEYDRVLLGGSLPRYMYGSNLKLDYKNFDFSMVLQGVGKINTRLGGLMVTPLVENWGNVPKILDGPSWSKYNTDAQNRAAKYPRLTYSNAGSNYLMSDYWLMNGGYIRLKNITLGYNLPTGLVHKAKFQKVRVYASASDILTYNKFPKGWDPEVSASGYPITASYVFGLSVTF